MNIAGNVPGKTGAIIVLFLLFGGAGALAQSELSVVDLQCSHRVNPLGIGDVNPTLSWQLQSTGQGTAYRGEAQTAYEIQVGSSEGTANLWDSGKVVSSQTVDMVYAGQPLTSDEQCYWQVRAWDNNNNVSAWSATANGRWAC